MFTFSARAGEPLLKPYGFLRLDVIGDDSRMQHPQYAFWVLSEDPAIGIANDGELTIHPRVSRLGVKITPQALDEKTKIRGVVEIDFQNGGSESRETPRMRLAYFEISRSAFRFLGGQDWDVISPLYPTCHTDGILWNAGNLGDRRPQATIAWEPGTGPTHFSLEAAAAQGGAIDNQDLDANSLIDGVDSGTPQFQGRAGFSRERSGGAISAGVWGHYGQPRTSIPVVGETRFESWSAGFDVNVPLGRVWLKGEGWTGKNLSDVRGGIGQGVNVLTGKTIESSGGWGEIGFEVSDPLIVAAGASIDDPKDEQVVSAAEADTTRLGLKGTGRTRNRVAYVSTRWRPWSPFQIGLEYFYWVTEYRGIAKGTDNRFDLHFSYFF